MSERTNNFGCDHFWLREHWFTRWAQFSWAVDFVSLTYSPWGSPWLLTPLHQQEWNLDACEMYTQKPYYDSSPSRDLASLGIIISSADPTLKEGKELAPRLGKRVGDIWGRFWFLQAQYFFTFAKANQITALYDFYVTLHPVAQQRPCMHAMSAGGIALANENTGLWFCIALRSNMGLARIGMKSRTCLYNQDNVTRPFAARGFGLGTRLHTAGSEEVLPRICACTINRWSWYIQVAIYIR